jgi:PAS domain S-box-containing protein
MTVKRKIYIISLMVVVQTVLVCSALIWSHGRVQRCLAMSSSANDIMEGVSELNMLASEFLLVRSERPLRQWEQRVDSLRADINASQILLTDEAPLLFDILVNLKRVEEAKSRLQEYRLADQEGPSFRSDKLVERTVLFFLVASQNMTSMGKNLVNRTGARIDRIIYSTIAATVAFLVLFGSIIITAVFAVSGSIEKPLNSLVQAAKRIGQGRLDQMTGVTSKDEIGLFARAFDAMIVRLGEITVSRDELAAEVDMRRRTEEALKRSETRYKTIFDNGIDGISVYEVEFAPYKRKLIDCNEAYARAAGMPREKLLDMGHVDHLQVCELALDPGERLHERILRGEPYDGMLSWRRPDGQENYIEFKSVPIVLDGRNLVFGIGRDVTWRKKTEEKLRSLSRRVISAQEMERKRIGHELHDGTGQTLSALKILLEREIARLKEKHPDLETDRLEKLGPLISDTIVEVRRILSNLRPSMLDDLGLVASMNWFCREFEVRYPQIKVDSELDVDENVLGDAEKTANRQ